MKIYLTDLEFFGFHGLYEAEKKIGNRFKLDIVIDFTPPVKRVEHIDQTIDYVQVYNMIKERMAIATPLLETVLEDLVTKIHQSSTLIKSIAVSIKKINPPIENFSGSVGVSLKKNFSV